VKLLLTVPAVIPPAGFPQFPLPLRAIGVASDTKTIVRLRGPRRPGILSHRYRAPYFVNRKGLGNLRKSRYRSARDCDGSA